jgi:amidophosphoribosyltransferase
MPTKDELVAHNKSVDEIRQIIDCDALIYQDVDAMKLAVASAVLPGFPKVQGFDASCFDGIYVTGDVSTEDIERLNENRPAQEDESEADSDRSRLALPNAS